MKYRSFYDLKKKGTNLNNKNRNHLQHSEASNEFSDGKFSRYRQKYYYY